ncbi:sugar ABC transporter permease [Flexivirga endophytica]|uniref:Autoinducer 2 import system permease protein LsrD n=1 Tax=Flexivirga endophytica TaxID=1849103 RepID=A0A916T3L6_9MICO|nr:ABC transporter permease [Flexivirga endophytica]GGB29871.1 sugar ABC transporter permease [Flexivirga endophytica]GHB50834.1 sugar ABC transporter permease [Flexivirga endophytica]
MTSDVQTAPTGRPDSVQRSIGWRDALRWEGGLVVVLIAVLIFGSAQSSSFLSQSTIFYAGINIGYIALMALPMTFIIMTGEIDLSVASMLGLAGSLMGFLWHHGWGIWPAIIAALVVGALGGALNGVLVAYTALPSIAVTIGTLTLFRGVAQILLGSLTVPGVGDPQFPDSMTKIGTQSIPGGALSYSTVLFLVLALLAGIVLHATPFGRALHAIGLQPEAASFSGVRVAWVKFCLFVVSGLICAVAGVLLTLQNASVSYTAGTGLELNVVAIVLFGGVSIFGGKGTIFGVLLSVIIFGALQMILTQTHVEAEKQLVITGLLLLISVIVANGRELLSRVRSRLAVGGGSR